MSRYLPEKGCNVKALLDLFLRYVPAQQAFEKERSGEKRKGPEKWLKANVALTIEAEHFLEAHGASHDLERLNLNPKRLVVYFRRNYVDP